MWLCTVLYGILYTLHSLLYCTSQSHKNGQIHACICWWKLLKTKKNEWISRQLTPCSVIHYRDVKNAQNKTNQRANIMISVLFWVWTVLKGGEEGGEATLQVGQNLTHLLLMVNDLAMTQCSIFLSDMVIKW